MRAARSSDTTGCTMLSGTFCPSTRISDCEVYFGAKTYETRNPTSGASSAGIRITFARRRNIAR